MGILFDEDTERQHPISRRSERQARVPEVPGSGRRFGGAQAETALRQDDLRRAVKLFTRALTYRDEAATGRDLATAQEKLISKGIAKYPDLPDGQYYRGRLLMKSEKYAPALKDFVAIEKQGGDFPQFHKLLGTCYFKTGEMTKARRALFKAQRKDRRDQEIKKMLAEIRRAGRKR